MGGGTSRSKDAYVLQYSQQSPAEEAEHEEHDGNRTSKPIIAPIPTTSRRLAKFSDRLPWLVTDVRCKGGSTWHTTISGLELGRVLGGRKI